MNHRANCVLLAKLHGKSWWRTCIRYGWRQRSNLVILLNVACGKPNPFRLALAPLDAPKVVVSRLRCWYLTDQSAFFLNSLCFNLGLFHVPRTYKHLPKWLLLPVVACLGNAPQKQRESAENYLFRKKFLLWMSFVQWLIEPCSTTFLLSHVT
jgi:hypothetical protein